MAKYTERGLVVKRPGVLSKVQMLNHVLGVGVFSLLPSKASIGKVLVTGMGSQHPSPNVKTFCKFEPQIWPETITSRDAKSACFKRFEDVM